MNLEDSILAAGPDTRVMVLSPLKIAWSINPFTRLVVEHARRGVPVVLASLHKGGPEVGRELLHALADLPPRVTTLGGAQFMRLAEAGALLETLDFEVLEFSKLTDYLDALRLRAGDPDWPTGVVAIDLMPSYESPCCFASYEPSTLTVILAAITAAGWTAILCVDTPHRASVEATLHE